MQKCAGAFLALLVIGVFAVNVQSQSGWTKFSSDSGSFSVLLPEKPKVEVENKMGKFGPYASHLVSAEKSGTVYLIGWTDYAPTLRIDGPGEIRANRDNYIKSIEGTLISEKEINLDGHPGIEFTAEM